MNQRQKDTHFRLRPVPRLPEHGRGVGRDRQVVKTEEKNRTKFLPVTIQIRCTIDDVCGGAGGTVMIINSADVFSMFARKMHPVPAYRYLTSRC